MKMEEETKNRIRAVIENSVSQLSFTIPVDALFFIRMENERQVEERERKGEREGERKRKPITECASFYLPYYSKRLLALCK